MNHAEHIILVVVALLMGMLMAFGLVLLFMFFGSNDACRSALYGLTFTLL